MSELDCQTCGACCLAEHPGHVPVRGDDYARLTPDEQRELTVFRGIRCFMKVVTVEHAGRPRGQCVNLRLEGGRYACAIYERRPQVCRDFERGGEACAYDRGRVYGDEAIRCAEGS